MNFCSERNNNVENKYTDRVKELRKELGVTLAVRSETKSEGPPVSANTRFPGFEGLRSVTQRDVDLLESFKERDVSVVMASRNAAARRSIPHLQERWCESLEEDAVHEISFQSGGWFHRVMHGMLQSFLKNEADPRFHDRTILVTDNSSFAKETEMGLIDRMLGHVYLVDRKGYIQWSAKCSPENQEDVGDEMVEHAKKMQERNISL